MKAYRQDLELTKVQTKFSHPGDAEAYLTHNSYLNSWSSGKQAGPSKLYRGRPLNYLVL